MDIGSSELGSKFQSLFSGRGKNNELDDRLNQVTQIPPAPERPLGNNQREKQISPFEAYNRFKTSPFTQKAKEGSLPPKTLGSSPTKRP